MSTQRLATAELVRLFDTGSLAGLSEWQLLERFVAHRDELAFQVLVSRHGPMVLGICRRMLGNSADVDDAFQATFLVLLRRAGSLGPGDAIAGWLHGVAVRVARLARSAAARRGKREQLGIAVEDCVVDPLVDDPELRQVLDEEINRLPFKYRAPIVLCYLEGQTHEQAARQLEWPLGTVKGRLARARSVLESRLTRRGLTCGTVLTALASGFTAEAAVPAPLLEATCRAASRMTSSSFSAHIVSASVASLIQGALSAMIFHKLKMIALGVTVSGLFLTGAAVLARQQSTGKRPEPPRAPLDQSLDAPSVAHGTTTRTDPAPDRKKAAPRALPDLYHDLIQAARKDYITAKEDHQQERGPLDRVHRASLRLMTAERYAAPTPTAKFEAVEGHFQRMIEMARAENESGKTGDAGAAEAQAFVIQAELEVAQANASQSSHTAPPAQVGPGDQPGKDPKSLAILAKLEEPLAMSFPNETPLEDVLKYIKAATQGTTGSGIPIYVDPLGLQEAEKTLTSPVQLDLEGIPLRRTLQLALQQLGLVYFVDDGLLVITSQNSEQTKLDPSKVEPSSFRKKREMAEKGEMRVKEMEDFAAELKVRKQVMNLITELQSVDAEGFRGQPSAAKPAQVDQPLKELKELITQLKSERGKSNRTEAK
jgi:RNA polymerase sigma factor (sigma-70 family)